MNGRIAIQTWQTKEIHWSYLKSFFLLFNFHSSTEFLQNDKQFEIEKTEQIQLTLKNNVSQFFFTIRSSWSSLDDLSIGDDTHTRWRFQRVRVTVGVSLFVVYLFVLLLEVDLCFSFVFIMGVFVVCCLIGLICDEVHIVSASCIDVLILTLLLSLIMHSWPHKSLSSDPSASVSVSVSAAPTARGAQPH